MTDDHKECAATSKAELEEYIMNPCIAKNDAEWWASREIERLRAALKPFAAIEPLPCDSDKMEFELWFLIKSDRTIDRPMIKVGDLRAAKAALEGK